MLLAKNIVKKLSRDLSIYENHNLRGAILVEKKYGQDKKLKTERQQH